VLGWELELAHLAVGSCGGGLGGPNRSTLLRVCAHDLLPRGRDSSPLSEDSFFFCFPLVSVGNSSWESLEHPVSKSPIGRVPGSGCVGSFVCSWRCTPIACC
jgi:hypothetical protein